MGITFSNNKDPLLGITLMIMCCSLYLELLFTKHFHIPRARTFENRQRGRNPVVNPRTSEVVSTGSGDAKAVVSESLVMSSAQNLLTPRP